MAILQNPSTESFTLEHLSPSYLLSLNLGGHGVLICEEKLLKIPPGFSMAMYTS